MTGPFQALAVDFDGTLTSEGQPRPEVLQAVADARERGLRVVLATGRILDELHAVFPDVGEHVDVVVAENGAVLARDRVRRLLVPPVDPAVDAELVAAGVPFRRGDVLLATTVGHEPVVADTLRGLGLDDQLIRNRGELMVVPSGVTKGSGVRQALADLGVSRHETIAVGDAENDLSMLAAAHVGVAVGNAIDSVKKHADIVLSACDGDGVREVLSEPFLRRARALRPARHAVVIGHDGQGRPVRLPAADANILVSGPSGSGKSHVAGLIAEQLIRAGYSLLITDPEGDYWDLRSLAEVSAIGSDGDLPGADEVIDLVDAGPSSLVVDLSMHGPQQRRAFFAEIPPAVQAHRMATGVPHWILVDEAHEPFGAASSVMPFFRPDLKGFILVSYLPHTVAPAVLDAIDVHVQLLQPARMRGPADRPRPARAVVVHADAPDDPVLVTLLPRRTHHLRHWHKYLEAQVPLERGFHWRSGPVLPTGAVSRNIVELHDELARSDPGVLRHHAEGHDLSRWIGDVIGDPYLGSAFARIERILVTSRDADPKAARDGLVAAIESRYL